jgi:hypothetical protein
MTEGVKQQNCRYASYFLNEKTDSPSYFGLESFISESLSLLAFDEFSEGMRYITSTPVWEQARSDLQTAAKWSGIRASLPLDTGRVLLH